MGRGRTTEGPLVVYGANAVAGRLESDAPVDRVLVAPGRGSERVLALARRRGVRCETADRATLDRAAGTPHHQGAVATTAPFRYADLERIHDWDRPILVLD